MPRCRPPPAAYEASASSCGTVTNNVLLNCPFVAKFSAVGSGTPSLIYGTYLGHTVISCLRGPDDRHRRRCGRGRLCHRLHQPGHLSHHAPAPTRPPATSTASTATPTPSAMRRSSPSSTRAAPRCWRAPTSGVTTPARTMLPTTSARMGPIALDAAGNVYIAGAAARRAAAGQFAGCGQWRRGRGLALRREVQCEPDDADVLDAVRHRRRSPSSSPTVWRSARPAAST